MEKKFKKIIQVELNEVSLDLIKSGCETGRLLNFKEVLSNWQFTCTSSENKHENIEPWIQWVSAHTGKTFEEHQIFRLSDVHKLTYPQIWEALSALGIESAIVGCMNALRGTSKGGVFFPDPWAVNGKTYPDRIQPLWNFISGKVQSHAVQQNSFSDLIKGLRSSFSMGVPLELYLRIGLQFIQNKLNPLKKWKMAALFDEFVFSIFEKIIKKSNYGFNAIFLNAMAHYQHHYWRNYDPRTFSNMVKSPDCEISDNPILYGLDAYDKIIGKVLKFQTDDTLIMIMTGLSQIPYTAREQNGGMHYFRLKNHVSFAETVGLTGSEILPLMSRDWQLRSSNEETLKKAEYILNSISVKGAKLFSLNRNSANSIFIETSITDGNMLDNDIELAGKKIGKFKDFFSSIAVKSGYHSGVGYLWTSHKIVSSDTIPITKVYDIALEHIRI